MNGIEYGIDRVCFCISVEEEIVEGPAGEKIVCLFIIALPNHLWPKININPQNVAAGSNYLHYHHHYHDYYSYDPYRYYN